MRITKVYTRSGDKGTTRLVGGKTVSKAEPRICTYGTIDELNSIVGLARTFNNHSGVENAVEDRIDQMLARVQNDLFDVGSDLATPPESRWENMHRMGDVEVTRLEEWIDAMNDELDPLKEFILPGGGPVGAFLHQARTVCRRAERELVGLLDLEPEVGTSTLRYVNRLSDFFFVLSRWAAKAHGEPEFMWERT